MGDNFHLVGLLVNVNALYESNDNTTIKEMSNCNGNCTCSMCVRYSIHARRIFLKDKILLYSVLTAATNKVGR